MAIIIPSKHIYSKSFDPVIDNVINKVYTNEYYGSYEQKVFFGETFVGYTPKTSELSAYITDYNDISSNNALPLVTGISGVARTLTLSWQKEVSSFKLAKDWLLYTTTINKEVDQEINLEMSATYKYFNVGYPSGMVRGEASYSDEKEILNLQFELKEFSSAQAFVDEYFDKTTQQIPYLPDYTVKSLNDSKLLIIGYIPTQTTVTFYFLINKDGYYYDTDIIRSPILESVDIKIFNNVDWQVWSYGNQNKPFVINDNKSKLLQTNTMNGDLTQGKYLANNILDEWKDGKQTAVIACPITDYYDENLDIVISTKKQKLSLYCSEVDPSDMPNCSIFTPMHNAKIKEGMTFYIIDGGADAVKIQTTKQDENTQTIVVQSTDFIEDAYYPTYTDETLTTEYYFQYPFVFNIGDVVIPRIYTNKGDKPLSYNKDFTPKQFKVVGTKISKQQGGMQELTLQEV